MSGIAAIQSSGAAFFAGTAFLWSDLAKIIRLDHFDRSSVEFGAEAGLNEGITVPYFRLGDCVGSRTFAGMRQPEHASRHIGIAQIGGTFAFQAALRLTVEEHRLAPPPRLHPQPRDCVALVRQGLSNKQIARALALAPRTVDGYLTEARRLFDAHDRTGRKRSFDGSPTGGSAALHKQPMGFRPMSIRSQIASRAPATAAATDYDRYHLGLYAALLDTDAAGESWQEVAETLMGLDPEDPGTEECWRSHLARAQWIIGDGLASATAEFGMGVDGSLH